MATEAEPAGAPQVREQPRGAGSIASRMARFLLYSLDSAGTASLHSGTVAPQLLRELLSRGSGKSGAVRAVVGLVDAVCPGFSRRLSQSIYRWDRSPFRHMQIEILGFGWGSSVFLLRDGGRSRVLKIYRRSLGYPLARILEVAHYYRERYQLLSLTLAEAGVVPQGQVLVLHGPILGRPAAALLQDYVPGPHRDLLHDFTDEELLAWMERAPALREQFLRLCEGAEALRARHNLGLDLVGRGNLIVSSGATPQIHLLDVGSVDLGQVPERWRVTHSVIMVRLGQLRERAATLEAGAAHPSGGGPCAAAVQSRRPCGASGSEA